MLFSSLAAPPKLGDVEEKLILKAGESKAIRVPYSANPKPKVTWTYKAGMFPDDKRFQEKTILTETCVRMAKVKRTDAGDYKVKLENEYGSTTHTTKLIVHGEC